MEKRTGTIVSIIAVLVVVISIIVLKSMETLEPKKEYTTTININGADIKLGITEEELQAIFTEETFTNWATSRYGIENKNARLAETFSNYRGDNVVFGKNVDVRYLFGWCEGDGLELREICIQFKEDVENEVIIAELTALYGEYKKSWWEMIGEKRESYRWDFEDGTSIVYQVSIGGKIKMLYIIRTEHINEEKFSDTYEES